MPEGDSIRRIAARLAPLVGEVVSATSPNPRGRVTGVAARVDGLRLERVDAVGKNLLLRFEGGVTVRNHLLMSGRWRVEPSASTLVGKPWLVLVAGAWRAAQWNGPVLELEPTRPRRGLDILDEQVELPTIVARLRRGDQSRSVGEALVDQRVVAGIGNLWLAEILWEVRVSPRARLRSVPDETLASALAWARDAMTDSVTKGRPEPRVYRRVGRPCPRCSATIEAYRHGDQARTMYVCPHCQAEPT